LVAANQAYGKFAERAANRAGRAFMLVDTSVWVDHFRRGDDSLRSLLDREEVESHPFIIGELACGSLRRRSEVLSLLEKLPQVPTGSHDEVLAFVELHRLMGRGIGWIDAHLLASAALAGVLLWTRDRRLSDVARMLRLFAQP
jgi:predicted nucleic acid-binding protein